MGHPSDPEDERLLFRARVVAVIVVLVLLATIVAFALVGPLVSSDYSPAEALLIVIVPVLGGALLPLLGIRTIINRKD